MTDKKFEIQACFKNKLNWTGAWLNGKGIDVKCPGGHTECTANMLTFAPFSEYDMGHEIGSQLSLHCQVCHSRWRFQISTKLR